MKKSSRIFMRFDSISETVIRGYDRFHDRTQGRLPMVLASAVCGAVLYFASTKLAVFGTSPAHRNTLLAIITGGAILLSIAPKNWLMFVETLVLSAATLVLLTGGDLSTTALARAKWLVAMWLAGGLLAW